MNTCQTKISEIKGHYLNVIATTCKEMIKRVIFSRELGISIVIHDYLIGDMDAQCTSLTPTKDIYNGITSRVIL